MSGNIVIGSIQSAILRIMSDNSAGVAPLRYDTCEVRTLADFAKKAS